MELIRPDTKIDFLRYRIPAAALSLLLLLVGAGVAVGRGGPNLGIDFAGGSLVQVRFAEEVGTAGVRRALDEAGLRGATIQDLPGRGSEFLIRLATASGEFSGVTEKVEDALRARFGQQNVDILRVEAVGPRVGKTLRRRGVLAVLFATVMIGIYIWIRFEWRFGLGAAVALMHDVGLALAALVAWNYEFDLSVIAALLTVVGYSVNDTVIVSDRIRENMRKDRRSSLAQIVNRSINETLSRTLLTSGTSLLVVTALFLLGGNVIHGFAFTLMVGFIVGTYSSVYIAGSVVLAFESWRPTAGRRG